MCKRDYVRESITVGPSSAEAFWMSVLMRRTSHRFCGNNAAQVFALARLNTLLLCSTYTGTTVEST
jgi:hypothetical protein